MSYYLGHYAEKGYMYQDRSESYNKQFRVKNS